jgi:hypothetical protein
MKILHAVPLILVVACLASCDTRHDEARSTATAGNTAATGNARPSNSTKDEGADVAMHYTCEAATGVALLRDGNARISLPDGNRVDLERIVGSKPTVFTGSSLYFTTGDHGAYLSQQDGNNELACKLQ